MKTTAEMVFDLVSSANRKHREELDAALRLDNPVALVLAVLDQIGYPLATLSRVAALLEVA